MGQPDGTPTSFLTFQTPTSRPLMPARRGPGESGWLCIPPPGGFPGVPCSGWAPWCGGSKKDPGPLLGPPPGGSTRPGAHLGSLGAEGSGSGLRDAEPWPRPPLSPRLPASRCGRGGDRTGYMHGAEWHPGPLGRGDLSGKGRARGVGRRSTREGSRWAF